MSDRLTEQQVADLESRLVRAAATLDELAEADVPGRRHARLVGKAEGLRLALSYLDEYERGLLR